MTSTCMMVRDVERAYAFWWVKDDVRNGHVRTSSTDSLSTLGHCLTTTCGSADDDDHDDHDTDIIFTIGYR